MILVISTSLHPNSHSRKMAQLAFEALQKKGCAARYLDLQTLALPHCDGDTAYSHPNTLIAIQELEKATGIILATPIYNYSASASCKNLIELTGNAWRNKPVAIIASSGSIVSYMAPSAIIISLLLDFQCHIVPKIVTADGSYFSKEGDIIKDEIRGRIDALVDNTIHLHTALDLVKKL